MRLRGILVNRGMRCPVCGEETMRKSAPFLLRPMLALTMGRLGYRWCRRCLREWIAVDRPRGAVRARAPR